MVILVGLAFYYSFLNKTSVKMIIEDVPPQPSVKITDNSKNSKKESNSFIFTEQKDILFKQIFWNKTQKSDFYQNQIKTNDTDIDKIFEQEQLTPGPLPKNYEISMNLSEKELKPSVILGKIKDEKGNSYNWEQPYQRKDNDSSYLINIPDFQGESAKVSLRIIWLNDDDKCYGVAEQLMILKKTEGEDKKK